MLCTDMDGLGTDWQCDGADGWVPKDKFDSIQCSTGTCSNAVCCRRIYCTGPHPKNNFAFCLGFMRNHQDGSNMVLGMPTIVGAGRKENTKNALKLPGVTCATTPFNCNAENGYNQVPNFSDKPCPNGVCTNPVCCISMSFKATLLLLALTVRFLCFFWCMH